MGLTDHCDVYVAVQDLGIDRVVNHLFRQRPSLFNYVTEQVARRPDILCEKIDAHPIVAARGNPLVTITPPLPVFGSSPSLALNYAIQIRKPAIDFSPGNTIKLPKELDPLGAQRFAITAGGVLGFGCPDVHVQSMLPPEQSGSFGRLDAGTPTNYQRNTVGSNLQHMAGQPTSPATPTAADNSIGTSGRIASSLPTDLQVIAGRGDDWKRPPRPESTTIVMPVDGLLCTCLDVYAVAGVDFAGPPGGQRLDPTLVGIEIVDLGPTPLEDSIECYARLLVRYTVFPLVRVPVLHFVMDLFSLASIGVEPSTGVPHNPASRTTSSRCSSTCRSPPAAASCSVVQAPVRGWVPVQVLVPALAPVVGRRWDRSPGAPRTNPRRDRRCPGGHLRTVRRRPVRSRRDGITLATSASVTSGALSAGVNVAAHMEGGTLDLRSDGSISLEELDVVFDQLAVSVGLNIPTTCFGPYVMYFFGIHVGDLGPCCFFTANPDISLNLDLSWLRSEISARLAPVVKYSMNPFRASWMNDWDARDAGVPNHWQLYVDPISLDLDLIDVADVIGDAIDGAINGIVNTLFGWLPSEVRAADRAGDRPVRAIDTRRVSTSATTPRSGSRVCSARTRA